MVLIMMLVMIVILVVMMIIFIMMMVIIIIYTGRTVIHWLSLFAALMSSVLNHLWAMEIICSPYFLVSSSGFSAFLSVSENILNLATMYVWD